jgi:hypothetical protein
MKMKLTDRTVTGLKLPPGKIDYVFFDDTLTGFGLRLRASGSRRWIVQIQRGSGQHRITIGNAAVLTAGQARQRAKEILAKFALGHNPLPAKHANPEQRIAEKFSRFAALGTEPKCYLYRQYGPTGDLLYVGVSLEPLRRQMAHFKIANWRAAIFRIVIEPFESREAALEAERQAIREEYPKFNGTHNGARGAGREIASVVGMTATALEAYRAALDGPPRDGFAQIEESGNECNDDRFRRASP